MDQPLDWAATAFMGEVAHRAGTPVSACVQCHKCSTGCPVGPEVDLLSSQVMRLVQLGQERDVLGSQAIWLCASCETCTTRCPMGIDVAGVMDALRMLAVERKLVAAGQRTRLFNDAFLASVRRHGRVFELGMMAAYKLRVRDLFSDALKVPRMLVKGKLPLLPPFSATAERVRRAFERAREEDDKR